MHAVDEVRATLARLIAYVLTLILLAIVGLSGLNQLPPLELDEPVATPGWAIAERSHPGYAVSSSDAVGKSESYDILRHPEGGRKDIFRWADANGKPAAELEIYRLGGEAGGAVENALGDLAARIPSRGRSDLEATGIADSKFGGFALFRPAAAPDHAPVCLGFLKRIGDPALRISGWSCHGDSLAVRRAAVGCLLNRLTLLVSGNDPKLAEFFARAELKRGSCAASATLAESVDWVTRTSNPRLRGTL